MSAVFGVKLPDFFDGDCRVPEDVLKLRSGGLKPNGFDSECENEFGWLDRARLLCTPGLESPLLPELPVA